MPTASYVGIPTKVASIGVITVAALIPANPVPIPAPALAMMQTKIVFKTVFILLTRYYLMLSLRTFMRAIARDNCACAVRYSQTCCFWSMTSLA